MACRQWSPTLLCWRSTGAPAGSPLLCPSPPGSGIWKCQSAGRQDIPVVHSLQFWLSVFIHSNEKRVTFLATGEMLPAGHRIWMFPSKTFVGESNRRLTLWNLPLRAVNPLSYPALPPQTLPWGSSVLSPTKFYCQLPWPCLRSPFWSTFGVSCNNLGWEQFN